jgi:DNA-binding transcriptional ArsR family regulator
MLMDAFTVLADPTRRHIIETLCGGERAFGELAGLFDMSRPAVSQHLKALRDAGVVSVRAEAQRRYYRLNSDGLNEVDAWLQQVRRFWNHRLDKLEQALLEAEKSQ